MKLGTNKKTIGCRQVPKNVDCIAYKPSMVNQSSTFSGKVLIPAAHVPRVLLVPLFFDALQITTNGESIYYKGQNEFMRINQY